MKYYFMPYDPSHILVYAARQEYMAKGIVQNAGPNKGKTIGKKQNQAMMAADLDKGILSTEVWYGPNTDNLKHCSDLKDQLWIRGHGNAGVDFIEGGRGGEKVSSATLVERIKSSGLPTSFTGAVICYNCHSGESGPKGEPFAKRVGKAMRESGYKNAKFFGFLGAMDSLPKKGSQPGVGLYSREGINNKELGTLQQATVQFHF